MNHHKDLPFLSRHICSATGPLRRAMFICLAVALLALISVGFGHTPVAQAGSAAVIGASDATAQAGDITVNDTSDVVADDGACTLREAIAAANTDTPSGALAGECPAGSGPDTITLASEATYTLETDELSVTSGVTIRGNGATVQRSPAEDTPEFRIFSVSGGGDLALEDLTVSNGFFLKTSGTGGGIRNEGTLTLDGTTVSGNADLGLGVGGGIFNSGTLILNSSTVSGNTINAKAVKFGGGGIWNGGTLILNSSTVSGNTV